MTNRKRFDLEDRTAKFGEYLIEFAKKSFPQFKNEVKIYWKEANEFNLFSHQL